MKKHTLLCFLLIAALLFSAFDFSGDPRFESCSPKRQQAISVLNREHFIKPLVNETFTSSPAASPEERKEGETIGQYEERILSACRDSFMHLQELLREGKVSVLYVHAFLLSGEDYLLPSTGLDITSANFDIIVDRADWISRWSELILDADLEALDYFNAEKEQSLTGVIPVISFCIEENGQINEYFDNTIMRAPVTYPNGETRTIEVMHLRFKDKAQAAAYQALIEEMELYAAEEYWQVYERPENYPFL